MRKARESGDKTREELDEYMSKHECKTCHGTRLKLEARMVRVGGLSGRQDQRLERHQRHRLLR